MTYYKSKNEIELEEARKAQNRKIRELEEENKKLNIIIENTKKEQKSDREHIEKLEEENKKLQEEIKNHKQNIMQDELEIIPKLEEENKKLKERIKELEATNKKRTADNWATFKS